MKKPLNVCMLVLTVIVGAAFGVTYWKMLSQEINHPPVISFDADVLRVSVNVTEEELLSGVTAADPEDGDITDSIVIESISEFVEDQTRIITYAAFDSAGNVSKASREMQYTDYRSPRIIVTDDLEYLVGQEINLQECVRVEDVLDGDITGKIRIIKSDYESYITGEYTITIQVTNSCGDTVEKDLRVTCVEVPGLKTEETEEATTGMDDLPEDETEDELEHDE